MNSLTSLRRAPNGVKNQVRIIVTLFMLSGSSAFIKKHHKCVLILVSVGVSSSDPSSDYANYYQGLWDCEADKPDELSFHRGDLIYILSKVSACVFTNP